MIIYSTVMSASSVKTSFEGTCHQYYIQLSRANNELSLNTIKKSSFNTYIPQEMCLSRELHLPRGNVCPPPIKNSPAIKMSAPMKMFLSIKKTPPRNVSPEKSASH